MSQINNQIICPRCGSANKAGENFCGDCGESLRQVLSDSKQHAPSNLIQQPNSDQINPSFENPSLLFRKPLLYWAVIVPLGLVNVLLVLLGVFAIFEFSGDPSGGDFLPNFFILIVGVFIIGLSYPGFMGLKQFHNGESQSKAVLFYELVVIGILSIATVVGPIIAILLILYLNSNRFEQYIEFVKHKKMNQWTNVQKSG